MSSKRINCIPESSTVAIADRASAMRREGLDVVDFSAGRAAEHSPESVCEAAMAAMRDGYTHQTPARGLPEFLDACAVKLQRDNGLDLCADDNVIATLGCKQGLVISLLATIDAGDEVIIEDPCFVSYAPTIELLGGVPVPLAAADDSWSTAELEAAVTKRTRAILLCSPHNPTGHVHTIEELAEIANVAVTHDLTVICDEVYEAVTWGGNQHTCLYGLPGMAERTIGIMGLTKTYSMGGWRIGYAYASAKNIVAMTRAQQHLITCASAFAQMGAVRALDVETIRVMRDLWADWEKRCQFATQQLNAHPGLTVSMPQGGFYAWTDISQIGLTSNEFCTALLEQQKVATVPGSSFGPSGEGYVRITCVRSWVELRKGLERILGFADKL